MRVIPDSMAALAYARDRSVHVRVTVSNETGWDVDLSDLGGYDWLIGLDWGETSDSPMGTANIRLRREVEHLSLAPDVATSPLNFNAGSAEQLLREGKRVWIEAQLGPVDSEADPDGEWIKVFEGVIDDVDLGNEDTSVITLACRDLGARLTDFFIEDEQPPVPVAVNWYTGLSWPMSLKDFIQSILTNLAPGAPTLWEPSASGYSLNQPKPEDGVKKGPLLDYVRKLANAIGWDCRYLWNEADSEYQIALYQRDRTISGGTTQVFEADFYRVDSYKRTQANLRNRVRVVYSDSANGRKRTSLVAEDVPSQDTYGTRFCELAEEGNGNIDTAAEAQRFADTVLQDLVTARADATISMPFLPFFSIGDPDVYLLNAPANGAPARFWSGGKSFALVGHRHTIEKDKATTTLTLKEVATVDAGTFAPMMMGDLWLAREARPGVAPSASFNLPGACRCAVYDASGLVSFTALGILCKVKFDTKAEDKGGDFDAASSMTDFTAPSDGTYRVSAGITWAGIPGGTQLEMSFVITGFSSNHQDTAVTVPALKGTGSYTITHSVDVYMVAGDVLTVWGSQSTAGAITNTAGRWHTYLNVSKISGV